MCSFMSCVRTRTRTYSHAHMLTRARAHTRAEEELSVVLRQLMEGKVRPSRLQRVGLTLYRPLMSNEDPLPERAEAGAEGQQGRGAAAGGGGAVRGGGRASSVGGAPEEGVGRVGSASSGAGHAPQGLVGLPGGMGDEVGEISAAEAATPDSSVPWAVRAAPGLRRAHSTTLLDGPSAPPGTAALLPPPRSPLRPRHDRRNSLGALGTTADDAADAARASPPPRARAHVFSESGVALPRGEVPAMPRRTRTAAGRGPHAGGLGWVGSSWGRVDREGLAQLLSTRGLSGFLGDGINGAGAGGGGGGGEGGEGGEGAGVPQLPQRSSSTGLLGLLGPAHHIQEDEDMEASKVGGACQPACPWPSFVTRNPFFLPHCVSPR